MYNLGMFPGSFFPQMRHSALSTLCRVLFCLSLCHLQQWKWVIFALHGEVLTERITMFSQSLAATRFGYLIQKKEFLKSFTCLGFFLLLFHLFLLRQFALCHIIYKARDCIRIYKFSPDILRSHCTLSPSR